MPSCGHKGKQYSRGDTTVSTSRKKDLVNLSSKAQLIGQQERTSA
jgi:hypothetical protein